jgi:outer membrane lipase/esterase
MVWQRIKSVLGVSVLALAAASSAVAQTVTLPTGGRVITFGDSLSDNGNLFGLIGTPPPPYFGGRFSNGITWTEIISGGSQGQPFLTGNTTGNVNLAFGGARTDTAVALPPGIPDQVVVYRALGGLFSRNDLVTVLGGANNIFQAPPATGVPGLVAAATGAANDVGTTVNQIAGFGAGTILVGNLPNLGITPAYSGNPLTAGAGTLATNTFNQQLTTRLALAAAANPGANIILMDLNAAFAAIVANPTAFGLTNTTQQCVQVLACVTGSTATQNQFLFWDSVHPTARGHQLTALYAALLVNPQATAARGAVLGNVAAGGRGAAADSVLERAAGWAQGQYESRNGAWIMVSGAHGDLDAKGALPAYRYTLGGVRVGVDRAFGSSLVGGSLGANSGSIGGVTRADVLSFDADLYSTYTSGPFFLTGALGASWMSFDDIKRNTGFGPVDALGATTSTQVSAALEAGLFFRTGAFTISPSARLQAIRAQIAGYQETGLLALAFESRTVDLLVGGVRLRASAPLDLLTVKGTAFGEIGYEKILNESQGDVVARFVGNVAQPFAATADGAVGRGLNFKLGYDAKLTATTSLTLSYGVALQEGAGTTHTGQARIKMPF